MPMALDRGQVLGVLDALGDDAPPKRRASSWIDCSTAWRYGSLAQPRAK
jgi:hypothetical protein